MAAAFREGHVDDVLDHVHASFRGEGLDRRALGGVLLQLHRSGAPAPYVASVLLEEDEEGADERQVTILGILARGDPARTAPRNLRAFRIKARLAWIDGAWLVMSATLER